MPTFTDCLGREWNLRVTLADLRPLREMGIDCAKVMTAMERLPDVLFGDAERLATAVYRLSGCKLTTDEFAEGIDGPALESAGIALVEACVDFFPHSRIAQAMKGKVREALAEMGEQVASKISNASVGSWLESQAAGPTPAA